MRRGMPYMTYSSSAGAGGASQGASRHPAGGSGHTAATFDIGPVFVHTYFRKLPCGFSPFTAAPTALGRRVSRLPCLGCYET
jgi:hypothetical protein